MGLPLKPLESPSLDSARQHAIPGLVAQDYHVQYCVALRAWAFPVRRTKELELTQQQRCMPDIFSPAGLGETFRGMLMV